MATITDDIGPDLLASEIVKVSQAARALLATRLKRRAIVLLIQEECPGRISKDTIEQVLDAAARLDQAFVKPAPQDPKQ